MDSCFYIVNDTTKRTFLFAITISLFSVIFFFLVLSSYIGRILPFSGPLYLYIIFFGFLFYFIIQCIKGPKRIQVDCYKNMIYICGFSKKLFYRKIPFGNIQSIVFFKEKKYEEGTTKWQKSIKITDAFGKILYRSWVGEILNYETLRNSCKDYFTIDYTIDNEAAMHFVLR